MVVQASDEQLIGAVAAGDMQALEALYDRYERAVYSFALQALGDQAEAEQSVVEAFRRVWQEASGYHPGRGRFALWLYHLAQASVAELWRMRRRRDPQAGGDASAVTLLSRQLRRALSGLPPELVQAVELAYFRGYTQAEIADRVGIPLGAVRARLTEAFNLLRHSLARGEAAPPAAGQHDLDAGLAAVYTLNLLPVYAARQFEAHLAGCERCRAEFAGFQAVGEILFHAVPLSDPDPGLKARVLDQVEHTALEVPPQAAVPVPQAAVTMGEPEPVRPVVGGPAVSPAAAEAAAGSESAPAGESPEPRWAPAPMVQGAAAPEEHGLPPGRPTGRRPRPVRSVDRLWPESGAAEQPADAAPEAGEPEAQAWPATAPADIGRTWSLSATRADQAPEPAVEHALPAHPVAPHRSLREPEQQPPAAGAPHRAEAQLPTSEADRPALPPPAPGGTRPHFRPAPLRAPVANPVAPHLALQGAAEPLLLAADPRRRTPPPEPAPVVPRRVQPAEAAPAPARPGEAEPAPPARGDGVAVARPRRKADPAAEARRQMLLEGLDRPLPLLPATPEPGAAEWPLAGLRRPAARWAQIVPLLVSGLLCFLVALAGAMTYSSQQLWLRVRELEALAMSRDLSLQKAEADAAGSRPAGSEPPVRVVHLVPPPGSNTPAVGEAVLVSGGGQPHIQLQVAGLPALQRGEVYQVWLVTKDGGAVSLGTISAVDAHGHADLKSQFLSPDEYQELFITREHSGATRPQGQPLLQGALQ